jgi:hypothetical protein
VLQLAIEPDLKLARNQRCFCSALPWVEESFAVRPQASEAVGLQLHLHLDMQRVVAEGRRGSQQRLDVFRFDGLASALLSAAR